MEYGTVQDGMVFIQKNPKCRGGEYWMKMDHFLRVHGADYFERKAAFKERQYPSTEERERRKQAKRPKKNEYAREKMARRRAEDPETVRAKDREYAAKKRNDPAWLEYRKAIHERSAAKNWDETHPRRLERQRIREEKESALVAAREARLGRITENKAKREALAATRKPVVRLTESEREQRQRDEKRNYKHRRRAIIRNQDAKATPKQIREAMTKAKGQCHYCRGESKLTIDHVIPIATGGSHTLDNIVFACHSCNSSKRDLPAHEFSAQFGMMVV